MLTNDTTYSAGSCASSLLSRGAALHGLPTPFDNEGGDGDCYPNEDNETGP